METSICFGWLIFFNQPAWMAILDSCFVVLMLWWAGEFKTSKAGSRDMKL
jgi:hypothetical protein